MNDIKTTLTEAEKKFCLIYTNGPVPYVGNEVRCYQLVFNDSPHEPTGEQEIEVSLQAHEFITREDVKDYIDKINAIGIVNAASLKPRITQTLLKIMDECSTAKYTDKWGVEISPAALRSVAVNAADKLTNMYGIKEDIAHKIQLEGADGEGITFNLITPQPTPKPEDELIG